MSTSKRKLTLAVVMMGILIVVILRGGSEAGRKAGFPTQSYDDNQLVQDLEGKSKLPDRINGYFDITKTPAWIPKDFNDKRDEIINYRLALINLHYNQFVAEPNDGCIARCQCASGRRGNSIKGE